MRMLMAVLALLVCGMMAPAQTPTFDITVVKENKSGAMGMKSMYEPAGMTAVNATMVMLLRQAYSLYASNDDVITGLPGWAEKKHFDLEAKVAPEQMERMKTLTQPERAQMLRGLLADRFGLVAHRVKLEQPVYALVVAKGGPKLTVFKETDVMPNGLPKTDARAGGSFQFADGLLKAEGVTLDDTLSVFTQETGRTVINETGLTGRYSFELHWTPDEEGDADNGKTGAPPLFTALEQQLGLRLVAKRGTVDGLVVDRLELPTAN